MNLENLDRAKTLYHLGMFSPTEARKEYLRQKKSRVNGMRLLNPRYVSNVTVGYCMKRTTTKNRLCPYVLPLRHRTKSENSEAVGGDTKEALELKDSMCEPSTSSCRDTFEVKSPAKRCQSLENLNLAVEAPADTDTSPELDCVSTRIQELHVDE